MSTVHKYQSVQIPITDIFPGNNVRLPRNLDIKGLAENMMEKGHQEPIVVYKDPENVFRILKGHRRHLAILEIKTKYPQKFTELFPDDLVNCTMVLDCTPEDVVEFTIDHGQILGLTDELEIYNCVSQMLGIGKSVDQIGITLSGLLNRGGFSKFSGAKRKVIDNLKAKLKEAKDTDDYDALIDAEKRLDAEVKSAHRGYLQSLQRIYEAPAIVWACWYYGNTGDVPEGWDIENLIPINKSQAANLAAAYKKDVKDPDQPDVSIELPGNNFNNKLNQYKKSYTEKGKIKDKTPSVKMMSTSDARDFGLSLVSRFGRLIIDHIIGNKLSEEDMQYLRDMDKDVLRLQCSFSIDEDDSYKASFREYGDDAIKQIREGNED